MTRDPINPTRAWALLLEGQVFDEWTSAELTRDIEDMSGSFSFELRDWARSWNAFPFATLASYKDMVSAGLEAEIRIDGETVLIGWVDTINPSAGEDGASVSISGSDKSRDLIDGAATVDGPNEYLGKTMDEIGPDIVKPYGLTWRSEIDVGKPFDRYVIEPGETALSALEKGLRQRAGLLTSDGVGGLVVTRTGARRAPSPLRFPGNVTRSSGEVTVEGRHSEYRVKGQAEKADGKRGQNARHDAQKPLDSTAGSLFAAALATDGRAERERAGVAIEGKASDPDMQRYRPLVTLGRTQLTAEGAQQQAEWMARTARGQAERLDYEVKGHRGESGELWRPNELAAVSDAYQGVERDMLIAGVTYRYDEDSGAVTALRITSPEAYDTEPVGNRRTNRQKAGRKAGEKAGASDGPLDSTAGSLWE